MRPLDPRLLRAARPTAVYVGTCAVLGTATAVAIVVQATVLADVVSTAFLEPTTLSAFTAPLLVLCGVVVARAALAWAQDLAAHRASASVKSALRSKLIAHALRLGPAWLRERRSASLVTLTTSGLDSLDGYFAKYLPQLVLAATVPLVVGVRLATADWLSAVVVGVTLPLVPVFMVLVGMLTQVRTRRRWRALQRLAYHFTDVLAGLPTLRAFGRAKAQVRGVTEVAETYRRESLGTMRIAFLSALVLELVASLSVAVVAVEIGLRVIDGHLDLATGLLVLVLAPEVYLPLRQVGAHYHASADGLAAAEDAFAVLETPPPAAGSTPVPDLGRSDLVVGGLTVPHEGRAAPAPDGLSLVVHPGEVVAVTGASGSGKSTLVDVLLCFVTDYEGTVTVGGVDLADLDAGAWRRCIAWVPQRPNLLPGTVASNLLLGIPDADAAAVSSALEEAGCADVAPETPVGENGIGLSAGQLRRVALARALLRIHHGGARMLVLDEPTAGLDTTTEAAVVESVGRLGHTVLLVTHRPALLAAADRIVTTDVPAGAPA